MIFEYSPITGSGVINGVGPTTVLINPSAIDVPYGLITKIEYLIFDAHHILIDTIVVNRRLSVNAGDPRNVIISHTFYPTQFVDVVRYYIRIDVTYSTSTDVVTVEEIDINIEQANLLGPTDMFASKIHLVANRMWGHNNQKMFALETTGPQSVYFVKPQTGYEYIPSNITPPLTTPPPTTPVPTTPPPTTPVPTTPPPTIPPMIPFAFHAWSEDTQMGSWQLRVDQLASPDRVKLTYVDGGSYLNNGTNASGGLMHFEYSYNGGITTSVQDVAWFGSITLNLPVQFRVAFTGGGRLTGYHGYTNMIYMSASNVFDSPDWYIAYSGRENPDVWTTGYNIYHFLWEEPTQYGHGSFIVTESLSSFNLTRLAGHSYAYGFTDGAELVLDIDNGSQQLATYTLSAILPYDIDIQLAQTANIPRLLGLHGIQTINIAQPVIPTTPPPTTPVPTTPPPTTPVPTTPPPTTPPPTILEDWSYRKPITIDHTKVAGTDLLEFPVLISLSADTDLATYAQTDGRDIVFTTDIDNIQLSHEIESYNSSTGALLAWVNVPVLSAGVDTSIFMYYGNVSATSQADPDGTWSNSYVMVQHLNTPVSGASPQFIDSAPVPDIASSFGYTSTWTVTGANNDAQAVCTDGTYIYYTSTTTLRKYDKSGVLILSRNVMTDAPSAKEQINGIFFKDGIIYASVATHAGNPYVSWIAEYNPTDLTYITHHTITPTFSGAEYAFSEGLTFHDNAWWVIWHSSPYLSRFDTSWNHVADYVLKFPINDGSSGNYGPYSGYDGVVNIGDFFYLNIHQIYNINYVDLYHWNGNGFDAVSRLARASVNATQGMGLDPSEPGVIWWANRNPSGLDGVVKGTLINTYAKNNGTIVDNPVVTSSKIGNGIDLDGINDAINCGNNARLKCEGHLTLEAWVRSDGTQAYSAAIGKIYGATSQGYAMTYGYGGGTKAGGWLGYTDPSAVYAFGTTDTGNGTWNHIAFVYDMTKCRAYLNGVFEDGRSDSATKAIIQSTQDLYIGQYVSGSSYWMNGAVDEVRVQHTARSANWLLTEYRNQNSPSTFYTIGSAQAWPI